MVKMVILFRAPQDVAQFEEQWASQFLPLGEQIPGIQRIAVSHVIGEPRGTSDYYKLHEFYFEDRQALDRALTSNKGVRAGNALMTFASDITTILFAEVVEEERMLQPDQVDSSTTCGVSDEAS